jgi:hypothetical protein
VSLATGRLHALPTYGLGASLSLGLGAYLQYLYAASKFERARPRPEPRARRKSENAQRAYAAQRNSIYELYSIAYLQYGITYLSAVTVTVTSHRRESRRE